MALLPCVAFVGGGDCYGGPPRSTTFLVAVRERPGGNESERDGRRGALARMV